MSIAAKGYEILKMKSNLFEGSHNVHTPKDLVEEILSKLSLADCKILVLFNLEFVISLLYTYEVLPENITLLSDHNNKNEFAKKCKINYIPELETGMKFDVVVGNPPYQSTDTDGKRKSLSTNLWSKFLDDGVNKHLKDGGHLAMITPASWAGPTKTLSGKRSILKDIFSSNNTYYINIDKELNNFFDAASTFSYYLLEKKPYDGKTTIKLDSNNSIEIDLRDYNSLPKINNSLAYSIVKKYSSKITSEVISGQLQSKSISYQEEKDQIFVYPAYHTPAKGGRIWYTNVQHPKFNNHKVIISLSGEYKPFMDKGTIGFTDMCLAYIVKPNETVESAYSVINSKLFRFIMDCSKWSGFNNKEVIRNFALPKLDRIYTDSEIYDYFDLTDNERSLVNDTIKCD